MQTDTDNLRGAAFMCLSTAGFSVNDALVKLASADLGLFQMIFVRGVMATLLIALLAWQTGALKGLSRIARRDRGVMAWRVIGELGATSCFLTALFNMPLANATAILQSVPLAITLAAALLLGEQVGWRRFTAIGVGFAGVMLIVRPGTEGFTIYSVVALGAVGFLVLRDLATRRLSPGVPSLVVTLSTSVAVTAGGGAVAAFLPWAGLSPATLALLAAAACALTVGYLFGVMAMRAGEIGFISPFRYAMLLWALILGVAVFGDWPGPLTLAGAALVIGTGIYSFRRERRLARALAAQSEPSGV